MKSEFESKRLLIRSLSPDHAMAVTQFYRRNLDRLKGREPNITENFLSVSFNRKVLEYEQDHGPKNGSIRYWFSFKEDPETLIGSVNIQNFVKGAFYSCQIGYKVDRDYCGLGLTTEAVSAAIVNLKADEDIHRVEAIIHTTNAPSIALVEHLGFIREGLSEKYVFLEGAWRDCYRYALIFDN